MIVTKDCGPLFDAFTAEGLNTQQLLSDGAAIVQNDGIELSDRDIDEWATDLTRRLLEAHRRQLQLITDTLAALREMKPEKVLGYTPEGARIFEITGGFATACSVNCHGCNRVIRGMGGPIPGALCPDCWEAAGV